MFYDHYFRHDRFPWKLWMAPHRGGHGFGHFGRGFRGGFGRGGMDFRTGRKLGAADLQLVILALLAERPSHGYEIIKAVEERSGGFYVPSPGVIYPALTYLEEIGYVTVEPDGTKKLYQITASGRQHLEQNRPSVDAMLSELARIGRKMERVRRVFASDDAAGQGQRERTEEGAGEETDFAGGSRELHGARRALKKALFAKWNCSREEARRIAAILRRAAEEIAGK